MSQESKRNGESPPEFDSIEPVRLDRPSERDEHQTGSARRGRLAVGLWALAGVLSIVALGGAFYLLPGFVPTPQQRAAPVSPQATDRQSKSPPPPADRSEQAVADSASTEKRTQADKQAAEKALAAFMDKRSALAAKGVKQWGAQAFKAALAKAESGDQALVDKDYGAAREAYARAGTLLDQLSARSEQVLAEALTAGDKALAAGDGPTAAEQFNLALSIDPDNAKARAGLERAGNMDKVGEHMASGRQHEDAGELEAAQAAYQKAVELDSEYAPAGEALARVNDKLTERRFTQAMSSGFTALEGGDFKAARAAFERARKIEPDAPAARDALAQVEQAVRLAKIAAHRERASEAEAQERWTEAAEQYRAALKIDSSLAFAQRGLARSQARAELAKRLAFHIDHPQRLGSQQVLANAQAALAQGREVAPKGPQLQGQLTKLAELIQQAQTRVPVQLRSDSETNVVVYQVGRLGQFDTREIELRPGTYTAVGQRDGYRDVRREFTVAVGQPPPPVIIRCTEKI